MKTIKATAVMPAQADIHKVLILIVDKVTGFGLRRNDTIWDSNGQKTKDQGLIFLHLSFKVLHTYF